MDLRALRYFIELVHSQSFTLAAERLHVTQPTVSKMIRALESEVGSPVLRREGRALRLTDTGEVVLRHGRQVLAAYGELTQALADLDTAVGGELKIGIPPMSGVLFTSVIAAFRRNYPAVELKLFEQGAKGIEAALLAGELELGALLQPADRTIFDLLPVARHPLWLVAPATSRWQGREKVELAELAAEPFVLYGESLALNGIVQNACRKAGFEPAVAGRSGHWDFIAALVEAGVGIALLPRLYCEKLDAARFTFAAITPELPWDIALAWQRDRYLSRAARAWLDQARHALSEPDTASTIGGVGHAAPVR
ncbi:LysR family transcriptional regulator [Chitinasiproducens palmae]|uniref:DNA-binding transcriptional regulator, LysR family n=1 Tax=Chitinasiproducens palmae TaxID=1770053 RepID=A0A1H2PU49_9BURK|nr:LysR family transcriptional regulator [Chitinasiproducens palmae]SDV50313.1 DNA-binding transcriptional regulator, LysR family [Chitinasiproducens palmae]